MCFNCVVTFLTDPIKLGTIIISFILSVTLLIFFIKNKRRLSNPKKIVIVYGSIFFFIFPFIFFIYGRTCQSTFLSCNFYQSILYSLPIALGISILLGFVIIPFIYGFSFHSKKINANHALSKLIDAYTNKLKIKKPKLYLIDKVEPVAFSFSHISPRIFISVGLTEILNKKELQSVLLHELGHIKQKSSFLKFTNTLVKLVLPISSFYRFHEELEEEEKKADEFTITTQKTSKYLYSAKIKIRNFYTFTP